MPTIQDIRAKFPQYDDVSDGDLVEGIYKKFYSDVPFAKFAQAVGYAGPESNVAAKQDVVGYEETPAMRAEDAARSAGAGGRFGLESLAGMAGDVAKLQGDVVSGTASFFGASPETAEAAGSIASHITPFPGLPTSEQIRHGTDKIVGAPYEPQTDVGPYFRTGAEFAAGSAVPQGRGVQAVKTSVSNAIKYGLPAGFASEAAGQAAADYGPGAETTARIAAGLGTPMTIARATAPKVARDLTAAGNAANAERFGVGLTRGQATQNPAVKSLEDATIAGGAGTKAQVAANTAMANQAEQVSTAGRKMAQGLGSEQVDNAIDIASDLRVGVQQQAGALKAETKRLYAESERLGASLDLDIVNRTLKPAINHYVQRELGAPLSQLANKDFDGARDLFKIIDSTFSSAPSGSVAVSVKGLDELRKNFTKAWRGAAANPNAQRAIRAVMSGFDDWFDAAIDAALVNGSPETLDKLKAARKAYAKWAGFAIPKGKLNDADRFIAKIIDPKMDVQPQDIARYVWGASKVVSSGQAVRTVRKLKKLFVNNPEYWGSIKQGAIHRAIGGTELGDPKGYAVISKNLKRMLNDEGKAWSREMYSAEERELIANFSKMLDTLLYQNSVRNPSNSGNRILAAVVNQAGKIGGAIGTMIGGWVGGMPGAFIGGAMGVGAGKVVRSSAGRPAAKLFSDPVTYKAKPNYLPAFAGTATQRDKQ
ncbi:MAG: hypothetical protein GY807_21085 [Gammaproteobacteria bacterium]|nr:hypothetical protein [Gammaproteobacteria bacterium]